MLNFIPFLKTLMQRPGRYRARGDDGSDKEWEYDPLSHPALERMTLEELADLPFDRGARPSQPVTPSGKQCR
jgi:hypothetical protein